jgi:hypothetical protein
MPIRNPVLFLENDLRSIEDTAIVTRALTRKGIYKQNGVLVKLSGILLNYMKLRPFLQTRSADPEVAVVDFDSPILSEGENKLRRESLRMLQEWCHQSRKAFAITDELKDLLVGMSFGDLRWEDLVFPHPAFALSFETPLRVQREGDSFDSCGVLAAWVQDKQYVLPTLFLRFFSKQMQEYIPLNGYHRSKALDPRTSSGMLRSIFDQLWSRFDGLESATLSIGLQSFEGLRVADTQSKLSEEIGRGLDHTELYRLIAGFCFYLQTLPSGSPHRSQRTRVKNFGKPDPNAITNGAEICTVSSSVTLTQEERKAFGGEGRLTDRELSAHFRRGHFRRAVGTGNDPNAPKVVIVRPTMVRKDRIRPGELVGGSQVTVKPPS